MCSEIMASTPTNIDEYYAQFIVAALFFFILSNLVMTIPWLRQKFCDGRKFRFFDRMVISVLFSLMAGWGVTKGILPSASDRLGNWLLARNGALIGDESGVVAEAAQASAVDAYESETAGILETVRIGLTNVSERLTSLTNSLATHDIPVFYIVQDAPRDLPGYIKNHNLAVTQERMAMTATNTLSVWFRYSWDVSSAASITVRCYVNSNDFFDLESYTNTFPVTETFAHSDGVQVECYRYDYDVSPLHLAAAPMAMIPPYEATFGGPSGEPFEVPGEGLQIIAHVPGEGSVTTNDGFTGWIRELPGGWGTNLQLRCVGGSVVQATWYGTNITGTVTL